MELSDAVADEYFSNMNYRWAEKEGESCKNCRRCHKCAFGVNVYRSHFQSFE